MGAALTVSEEHATPAEIIRSRCPFRPFLKSGRRGLFPEICRQGGPISLVAKRPRALGHSGVCNVAIVTSMSSEVTPHYEARAPWLLARGAR
jgi:hypothetical protein